MEVGYIEEYIYHFQKLVALLENDRKEISKAIEGEICDEYRNVITRELEQLYDARKQLQKKYERRNLNYGIRKT